MIENSEEIISEKIRNFEKEENLFSFKVRNISIWRVVRSFVFASIQSLGVIGERVKIIDILAASLKSLPKILYSIINRNKIRYGVISYPFALRVKDDGGRYSDFYYQEILNSIPGGVRLSGNPILKKHGSHKKGTLNLDLSFFYLLSIICSKVFPVESGDKAYAALADAICRGFSIDGVDDLSLRKWFSFFWWESRLRGWFFRILGLEFVFIINSGEYSTINACVVEGIKIIELQHGIYTINNPDVLSNDVVITHGRRALFLPDVIALYGDYWVEQLAPIYSNTSVRVIPVGHGTCEALYDRRVRNYSDSGSGVVVLVTTQGIQKKELIAFLKCTLEICSEKVVFIVKLHPLYDRDKDAYLHEFNGDARMQIIAGDESPSTSDLLSMVDLHASIASACHYDALSIGVPTVVIGLPGSELVFPLVKNGSAALVSNPMQMARLIESRGWVEPTEEMRHYYCSPGFLDNIKKII